MDSITKDPLNLVRGVARQRLEVDQVWLTIASLAESRSKTGRGIKPSLISNLRSEHGTQVETYIYCSPVRTGHVCTSLYARANY